jgi:zinc protease
MPDMTLPVDTAVRMGKLDNGLTYYIRYNNWPRTEPTSTSPKK